METITPTTQPSHAVRLTAELREYLRRSIDLAVRATLTPPRHPCGECGVDTADVTRPVIDCGTCQSRFWRRRQRAQTA